jgi:gliding motility-associated-like protein
VNYLKIDELHFLCKIKTNYILLLCISSIFFAFNRFLSVYLYCQNNKKNVMLFTTKLFTMKNKLLLVLLLGSFVSFSQSISVSTSSHTVPELVTNVLVNSPCLQVSNINWITGTNFGSVNGIGYFENTNPNFPLQSGVILSTGNVLNAQGPNTTMLNDGSNDWSGDSDLQNVLAQAGIAMNSVNASVLEFEFVALSPHFDFDFLFASEEYGNFQCQFSDAFAFLLTNLSTGVTTNLAVVPSTTTPISVVTIRDFLYNSSCQSVNSQFFGSFNGGSNAASAPINFNGQTKVMNAAAVLTAGISYKIKLVIADRADPQSDSAIFLSANAFNIGQNVLGPDLTNATNYSLCFGVSHTLTTGLNPADYSFTWKRNGAILNGQTGASLVINQAGTYVVTYSNNAFPCQTITDEIIVQYQPQFVTPNPKNIYRCNSGESSYTFNLATNTPIVTAGLPTGTLISYHVTADDATSNGNPLPAVYTSIGNQTIYVRIQKNDSSCFIVKTFELQVTPPPIAHQPTDFHSCGSINNPTSANFNLALINPMVLNGQSTQYNIITYHLTQATADSGTSPVAFPIYGSISRTLYIRIRNITDPSCFATTSVNLVVDALPIVDVLEDVIVCDSYVLPTISNGNYFTGPNGTGQALFAGNVITQTKRIYIYRISTVQPFCPNQSSFLVTIVKPESLTISSGNYCGSYLLPSLTFGNYFTQPNGTGSILAPGTTITETQNVYFYFISTVAPFCEINLGYSIVIVPNPMIGTFENIFDCSAYILPTLSVGNYFDAPHGAGNSIPAGTAITATQTIFVYAHNYTCTSEKSFTVFIGLDAPISTTECVSYTLPELPIGGYFSGPNGTGIAYPAGTQIVSTQTIYVYAVSQSEPNCTDTLNFTITITLPVIEVPSITTACEAYILPSIPVGNYFTGPNGTGTLLLSGHEITSPQTLFIYLNNGDGCENGVSFEISPNQKPKIDARGDIDGCNSYVLTNLTLGNYYTGPNGTGQQLNGGHVITESQLIYIYATGNGCFSETSFQVNVFDIQADSSDDIIVCDSYVLPNLSGNNLYYTAPNGSNGFGTVVTPGTVITNSQTLYIHKKNQIRPSFSCVDENSFTITVNITPVVASVTTVSVCNSYILPALTIGNYYTESNGGGTMLTAGTELTRSQLVYVYAETGTTPNCFDQKSFQLNIFNVDEPADVISCSSYTLPALISGKYFRGPNATGGQLNAGTVITTSQTLYIFANSNYTQNCSDEHVFNITIVPQPVVNNIPIGNRRICDEDGLNDGITSFDLTTLNSIAIGSQNGAEFVVSYYASLVDATGNINALTSTTLQNLFIRVSNTLAPNCYDIKPLTIIVHKLPEPTPVDGYVCVESGTGVVLSTYTIAANLSSTTHNFEWYLNETRINGEFGNTLTVSAPGMYFVVATNIATGCSSEPTLIEVLQSEPAAITFTVSMAFSSTNSITINAIGNGGNYEYQLNNSPFQDSPTFDNVSSGIHTVTVRDKNGCGSSTEDVLVVNYPKFFTPNGDGFNDTWNIKDLANQTNAVIYIYDRYGKLVKQIYPNGAGWDGTFNSQPLSSSDYWFTVNYEENNSKKEFKAHFSLKR